MHDLFVILDYISVFIMMGSVVLFVTHENGKMQKLALMVCTMLLISCLGFLIKSEAKSVDTLITGQKLVYASVTHGMFLMLLFILEYCKFSIPKIAEWIVHGINMFISVIVLTLDHHDLFYVDYWAEEIDGNLELMKNYGPIHTLAVAVFVIYMLCTVAAAIEFTVKNVRKRRNYVWQLLVAVSFPCAAYIIPKLTGSVNELQPVAFSLFTIMLIILVYRSKIYDINNIAAEFSVKSVKNALVVFGDNYSYKGCNDLALEIFPFLADVSIDRDISKYSTLFKEWLDENNSEYTDGEKIYSVTVRPVELDKIVFGKVLWFDDVTIERNYTKLLTEQKEALENRVEKLYDISNKDELTGLFNRRFYEATLSELRKANDISQIVIGEIDINALKLANDNIGHAAGDELIIATANILTGVFSKFGKVFRTGGDEFWFILTLKNKNIEDMMNEVRERVGNWKGELVDKLSISYGIVVACENPEMTVDEMLIKADKEMYENKARWYKETGIVR